jgi:hypothetical protein
LFVFQADSASRVIDVTTGVKKKTIELVWNDGDSVGQYENGAASDKLPKYEEGYTPPKRERVHINPFVIGGVCCKS